MSPLSMLTAVPVAKTLVLIILSALFTVFCDGKDEDTSINGFFINLKADGNQFVIKDTQAADLAYCTLYNRNPISNAGKTHCKLALSGLGHQGGPYPILNMTIEK
ncbi:hypothetical protein [Dyadobacter psychrotolerans]|uniref:Uncharacterized protein n=1 Tax=Dyadobacter psychrotolerans TaxID=2541721 RepID=A0A4V6PFT2_9BACT|nr:hypothetical protein [Dyadobacter psychrotolerans]TDE15208.1 hypothetical protein E0F88_11830 [Dyadobacter psychrotolerans]